MAERTALALTSLAFNTLSDDDRKPLESLPEAQRLLPLGRALRELTDAPAVDRLVKLDQLVRLAIRRPSFFDEPHQQSDELESFLESLAPEGLDDTGRRDVATEVHAALRSLPDGISTPGEAWKEFAARTEPVLRLTSVELNKPECNDKKKFNTRSPGGTVVQVQEVIVTFDTAASVQAMADYADPKKWPSCSANFTSMRSIPPRRQRFSDALHDGWTANYRETCVIPPRLVTPLSFASRTAINGSFIRTTYSLIEETKDIVYDSGAIEVREQPGQALPTNVTAIKVIAFTSQLHQRWTTYACDTFWMELAINMARGCP